MGFLNRIKSGVVTILQFFSCQSWQKLPIMVAILTAVLVLMVGRYESSFCFLVGLYHSCNFRENFLERKGHTSESGKWCDYYFWATILTLKPSKLALRSLMSGTCHVLLIRQTQNLGLKSTFFMMPRRMRPSPSRKVAKHLLTSKAFIAAIPASTRRQHMKMKKAD